MSNGKMDWFQSLQIGDVLDIYEKRSKPRWYIGTIKSIKIERFAIKLLIHYNGWSKSYDEWIKIDCKTLKSISSKLDKLHTHTLYHEPSNHDMCNTKYNGTASKPQHCMICKSVYCTVCCQTNECKTCHDDQIQQLNYTVNILKGSIFCVDGSILDKIASYLIGIVTLCCNSDACDKEIFIRNKVQFEQHIDGTGKQIYYYTVKDVNKIKSKSVYLYGEYRRIFCNDCTLNAMKTCLHNLCLVKDVRMDIFLQRDGSSVKMCRNHLFCKICEYYPQSELILDECSDCNQYYCNECGAKNKCKLCYENKEKNAVMVTLNVVIGDIISSDLIIIIGEYSIGHIVQCCNLMGCNNIVSIKNQFDMIKNIDINGDKIYSYSVKTKATPKRHGVCIYGKRVILFCVKCTATHLNACQYGYRYKRCNNFEAGSKICRAHWSQCDICNVALPHKIKECKNIKCHNKICWKTQCSINQLCRKCVVKNEINEMCEMLANSLKWINDIYIIRQISQFAIGCVANCCKLDKYSNKTAMNDKEKESYNSSIYHCAIHGICNVCKQQYGAKVCCLCGIRYCLENICGYKRWCKNCAVIKETNIMINRLKKYMIIKSKNGKKIKIDDIIYETVAIYSIGYIVTCCNELKPCKNKVIINSRFQLLYNNNIYNDCVSEKYLALMTTINIYGKQRRIFCKNCTRNSLQICYRRKCKVKDVINQNYMIYDAKPWLTIWNHDIFRCYKHLNLCCIKCETRYNHFILQTCNYCQYKTLICQFYGCSNDSSWLSRHLCLEKRNYIKTLKKIQYDDEQSD